MEVKNKSISEIKNNIQDLKGKSVMMMVNKGRKHIVKFNAEVIAAYPSVFTIEADETCTTKIQSYAYSEIICGNVKIYPNNASI